MCQVVSYERQIWLRRARPAGQRQKWLQKEILKQPKQPPKPPQTAPTTLLQLKIYLATLGTDGRSQDWVFQSRDTPTPQERTRHLTIAGVLNRYGLEPKGLRISCRINRTICRRSGKAGMQGRKANDCRLSYLPKKASTPNNPLLLSAAAI